MYILINFQNANAPKLRINAHVEKLWEHSGIYNSKPSLKASLDSPQGGANIDSEIPVDLYKEIISWFSMGAWGFLGGYSRQMIEN